MSKPIHVLSLGAGVQSTAVYLLAMEGEIHLDAAIFADTGDEPQDAADWEGVEDGNNKTMRMRIVWNLSRQRPRLVCFSRFTDRAVSRHSSQRRLRRDGNLSRLRRARTFRDVRVLR